MVLPSSGLITLADLQAEFGGSNPISLSEYYKGGLYVPNSSYTAAVPTSGTIALQNFFGTSNVFTATISANTTSLNAYTWLVGQGWNEVSAVRLTIATGVYVYSNTTSLGALYNIPPCTIINDGFIMGCGGNGNSGAGGDALTLAGNLTLINNASGYIGGGGGGGAKGTYANYFSGGGGGAGGGTGGVSWDGTGGGAGGGPGGSGSNGSNTGGGSGPVGGYGGTAGGGGGDNDNDAYDPDKRTGGGGGGRILPGARSGYPNIGGDGYTRGSYGGGPEEVGESRNTNSGAGGGGWGAAGGNTSSTGGTAGKAVVLNGFSCTISGTTSQIYGAVA